MYAVRALVLMCGAAAALAGCLRSTTFRCETSADCTGGTCEPIGFCSFADSSCTSGSRFGELSGSAANQCVDDTLVDAGLDAPANQDALPDAPGCPASYVALAGAPGHLYRSITTSSSWFAHHTACMGDGAYLTIPDDLTELTAIATLAGNTIWIGINDQANEGVYKTELGATATFLPWSSGEPDDAPGAADCVRASPAGTFADDRCSTPFRAVCECEPR